ncbi:MAG: AI-2E family transporter [Candidatus Omnitrophota bacterium]
MSNGTKNPGNENHFIRRTGIVLGLTALMAGVAAALFYTAGLILLAFAAILFAIILRSLGRWLNKYLKIPVRPATAIGAFLLFACGLATVLLSAPVIVEQSRQLTETLPRAIEQIRLNFIQYDWFTQALNSWEQANSGIMLLIGKSTTLVGSLFNLLSGLFLMFVLAVFIAVEPQPYICGMLQMIPPGYRDRFSEIFLKVGDSLRWWVLGTMISMVITGLLTVIGLTLMNVPLAILLAVVAGALTFIPTLGPIIAGIPAVAIAFTQDPTKALYVILLYIVIQTIEGNLLTPLIMQKTIRLPPALILFSQILFGIIFGFPGLALAIPLLSAAVIIIKMIYIEDALKEGGRMKSPAAMGVLCKKIKT